MPTTREAQHCDGEHTAEIDNGNHTGIVTELCIAIAILLSITYIHILFSVYFVSLC